MPSFLDYIGGRRYDPRDPHRYKASTCISIDHEIVHGIPGDRAIKAGQIVSVDVGRDLRRLARRRRAQLHLRRVEAASPQAARLVEATRLGLMAGVAAMPARQPRRATSAAAIEDVAIGAGYGIVRGYIGHGIGTVDARRPVRCSTSGPAGPGAKLEVGMCLAIEPMFMIGGGGHRGPARRLDGRHRGPVAWPPTSSTPSR